GLLDFQIGADGDGDVARDVIVNLLGSQRAHTVPGLLADLDVAREKELQFATSLAFRRPQISEDVGRVAARPEDEAVRFDVHQADVLDVAHGQDDAARDNDCLFAGRQWKALRLERRRRARRDAEAEDARRAVTRPNKRVRRRIRRRTWRWCSGNDAW